MQSVEKKASLVAGRADEVNAARRRKCFAGAADLPHNEEITRSSAWQIDNLHARHIPLSRKFQRAANMRW
jgi:hypothetical protein